MKVTHLALLACLAAAVLATNIKFNLDKCQVESYDAWDEITIPCEGGSGNYQYKFWRLPKNWYSNKNKVYAPKGQIEKFGYFGVKVAVKDLVYQENINKCVLFNFENRRFKNIFDADFDFDLDDDKTVQNYVYAREKGYQVPTVLPAVVPRPNPYVPIEPIEPVLPVLPVLPIVKPVVPIFNIRYQFPSEKELIRIIIKGDVAWIKKVIDEAISSGQGCKKIADFLARLLTLIQTHITIFKNNAANIRLEITQVESELNFLLAQLKQLENNGGDINALKAQLNSFRAELSIALGQKSSFEAQISSNNREISDNQAEIYRIRTNDLDEAKSKYDKENAKVENINYQIQQLEKQIAALQKDKDVAIRNRDNFLQIFNQLKNRIDVLIEANQRLQISVRELTIKVKNSEALIASLNVKIEDIQHQISAIGSGNSFEISQIKVKIQFARSQIESKTAEVKNIELVLAALEGALAGFQATINDQYYSCYNIIGGGNGGNSGNGGVGGGYGGGSEVIVTPSDAFINYLTEVFGAVPDSNIRARFGGRQINLKHSSIFSPAWVKVYGIPYSAGYGNNMDLMETDFKCEEVSDQKIFRGKIVSINKNIISVKDKTNDVYSVHLGGCTRLESATGKDLPQIGDEVSWKGVKRNNGSEREYNGYHCTCY